MAKQNAYLDYLAKVPIFSACSRQELEAVARRTTDVTLPAGDQVVAEGRAGYEFFVVVDGQVSVTRAGHEIATLGPGDYFGELALLDRSPRTATVTTLTPVEAMVLSAQEFDAFLDEVPSVARTILAGVARRLRELESDAS
jgi:CRP/FNR family cyclic AMP-dependent transcriptional regulator